MRSVKPQLNVKLYTNSLTTDTQFVIYCNYGFGGLNVARGQLVGDPCSVPEHRQFSAPTSCERGAPQK